jgi:hypothetical protein
MDMEENENSPLEREDKILSELKQLKRLFVILLGTEDLPTKEKFSKAAITKAASEFKKMQAERGEWIASGDVDSIIKHAPYNPAKMLIEDFQFKNYFKRGSTYYFKRKDLSDLSKELKKRNINLKTYSNLLEDKEKFKKYIDSISELKGNKKRRRFTIPEGLENIFSEPYSPPNEELVRNEVKALLEEYEEFNLSEYVDLYYKKTYAVFKYIYHWDRYLDPNIKKHCKGWTEKFNYANEALKRILEQKKSKHEGD